LFRHYEFQRYLTEHREEFITAVEGQPDEGLQPRPRRNELSRGGSTQVRGRSRLAP
jgi:hypothetical protein